MNDVVRYEAFPMEGLAILRIDRPDASNAVSTAVMEGLAQGLQRVRDDQSIRALILTGTGSRVFISGGDLKEFHSDLQSEPQVYEKMSQMRHVLHQIATFPKPVIAAVNGAARGGGGEVAAACHFRIGSETSTIGFIQVKLGIAPGWGGGVLLQQVVGRQQALRMMLTGEVINAERAREIGFFDEVVPAGDVLEAAKVFAGQIAANSAQAVQGVLELMRASETLPLADAMERETSLCAKLWMTPEHDAAVAAFLNRKKG
ncbi:enoyl-CoA hydratase/isomerase family protein [Tumebacillus permanentifrigoris]|uniref:Enoyl-CoA hydratase/carnithine racemase n=1 Tax=Tumebacillus permanentifrigoris TaxID=378543 RepID=A0A316DWH9_9BACL|nr:enoyl-CoA hydratase/isomerase family protein [Tumebacillus permanentifrigoris]PWK13924.1 enoyl-CoA hydratase/carnithine racemase [Tumebacillus permanentifrigoris]